MSGGMIFAENCLKYWNAGLSAIPLRSRNKMPSIVKWQEFSERHPSEDEKLAWIEGYSRGNIGVVMGRASGLVAIDVDSDDPVVLQALEGVLPPSPWKRVGKKGYVSVYRWNEEPTASIQSAEGRKEIVGIMSTGRQFVLPPSIHPDTGMPYVANCELVDVLGMVREGPALPKGIEGIVRGALERAGVKLSAGGGRGGEKVNPRGKVSAGGRDIELCRQAGRCARLVRTGDATLKEAMQDIEAWVVANAEHVHGDDLPEGKGAEKVIEFMRSDVLGSGRTLPMGWDEGITDEERKAWGLSDIGREHRRLTTAEIIEDWNIQVVPKLGDRGGVSTEVERVLRLVAANPDITPVDIDRILKTIRDGSKIGLGPLRAQLKGLSQDTLDGTNHGEISKAVKELIERTSGELRATDGFLWQWQGDHWKVTDRDVIEKIIMDEFGRCEAAKQRNQYKQIYGALCLQVGDGRGLKRVDVDGINFINGLLTKDLVLLPHEPDHGCTYVLDYAYVPYKEGDLEAWAPLFSSFLEYCFHGDADAADKVEMLQQFMGATMGGIAPRFRKCLCMLGLTGCGKSVNIKLMQGLLPQGAHGTLPPTEWGKPFALSQLHGKLMNLAGELSNSENIPDDKFKSVVGGDLVQFERKYQDGGSFLPIAAHWFASNHLPKTRDTSDAFSERWLFLQFNHQVPEAEQDRELDLKMLASERETIAAWAMEGYRKLVKQGSYTTPVSCLEKRKALQEKLDQVEEFLSDQKRRGNLRMGVEAQGGRLSGDALHVKFRTYVSSKNNGIPCRIDISEFSRRMANLQTKFGFRVYHDDGGLPFYEDFRLVPKAA